MAGHYPRSAALCLAGGLTLSLAGCAAAAPAPAPVALIGTCDPRAAARLVGLVSPGDAEILRLTGATLLRRIAPGEPVTRDYRPNRVTVETDPASGRVVSATCG